MSDPRDKSQDIEPIAFVDLPTPEEHGRLARRLWISFSSGAAILLVGTLLAIGAALGRGVPLGTIRDVTQITMGVTVVIFGLAFAIPIALIGAARLALTIVMGYKSLCMTRSMQSSIAQGKRELTALVRDARTLVDEVRPLVEEARSRFAVPTVPLGAGRKIREG